jgi:hypothetical protein
VALHQGRARFDSGKIPSRDAKALIERVGDLVEAFLRERESG